MTTKIFEILLADKTKSFFAFLNGRVEVGFRYCMQFPSFALTFPFSVDAPFCMQKTEQHASAVDN